MHLLEREEKNFLRDINYMHRLSLGILLGTGVDYNTICLTLLARFEEGIV